jgi:hypothetical protein
MTMEIAPVEEVARIPTGDESRGQFKQGCTGRIKLDRSFYETEEEVLRCFVFYRRM